MPRKPRLYLPGVPCHVIRRGNDRDVCFVAEEDYEFYLDWLRDGAERYGCAVHAIGWPALCAAVNNHYYGRTGTLWQGRHKASLVDAERFLLTLYRYIELNPVRASMVSTAKDYRWSSYRCNALGQANPVITPHALYLAVDRNAAKRHGAYRALFRVHTDPEEQARIHRLSEKGIPFGNDRFQARIEALTGFLLGQAKRGRPRKHAGGDSGASESTLATG